MRRRQPFTTASSSGDRPAAQSLVKQIGGTLQFASGEDDRGTRVTVAFETPHALNCWSWSAPQRASQLPLGGVVRYAAEMRVLSETMNEHRHPLMLRLADDYDKLVIDCLPRRPRAGHC
jgi:hypothetical protein